MIVFLQRTLCSEPCPPNLTFRLARTCTSTRCGSTASVSRQPAYSAGHPTPDILASIRDVLGGQYDTASGLPRGVPPVHRLPMLGTCKSRAARRYNNNLTRTIREAESTRYLGGSERASKRAIAFLKASTRGPYLPRVIILTQFQEFVRHLGRDVGFCECFAHRSAPDNPRSVADHHSE